MNKITLFIAGLLFMAVAGSVSANQLMMTYLKGGDVQIKNPEISQSFYDELKGSPRDYFINSDKDFELYANILVPQFANAGGEYSLKVFSETGGEQQLADIDGTSFNWTDYYNTFDRDYYSKGPEFSQQVAAGEYKIEVYSKDNQGKYVLVVGQTQSYDILSALNIYWQLPLLKITFLKTSVLQFFLTPFGIYGIETVGVLLILLALIYYIKGVIHEVIKHNEAKTMLLTSNGMASMKDEIMTLLQKPTYDVTVAFVTTAAKPVQNLDYLERDLTIMRDEMRFNIEEVDIEGKTEIQVMKLLELKDIIFVEGGNTFYLLKAMRECNFEKVIRKLLKQGKVYIGVSAGSVVAGRTIRTSGLKSPTEHFGVENLKGLGLVPFDIFVHYKPEYAEVLKEKFPNPEKRAKDLRILTDEQAILVQGKEIDLIGEGEAVVI